MTRILRSRTTSSFIRGRDPASAWRFEEVANLVAECVDDDDAHRFGFRVERAAFPEILAEPGRVERAHAAAAKDEIGLHDAAEEQMRRALGAVRVADQSGFLARSETT